jgi:hypothetical protein
LSNKDKIINIQYIESFLLPMIAIPIP